MAKKCFTEMKQIFEGFLNFWSSSDQCCTFLQCCSSLQCWNHAEIIVSSEMNFELMNCTDARNKCSDFFLEKKQGQYQ